MGISKQKILIISPRPYNPNNTARTLKTFFNDWGKDSVAHLYFNTEKPVKGFCENFYQVTDASMLIRHFKKTETGKIYNSFLDESARKSCVSMKSNRILSFFYKVGRKKTPLIHLVRNFIWKEKYWKTDLLENWLDSFNPDVIFYDFIDDNYGNEIALYISKSRNIPIVSYICDDYYFNDRKSISLFYHIYRKSFKKTAEKIILSSSERIYICDLIKDRYSEHFNNKGMIVYTTSDIKPDVKKHQVSIPKISYLGNLSLGRWRALLDIAAALQTICSDYKINVYSNEKDKKILSKMKNIAGIDFRGSVPYFEVEKIIKESNLIIHTESFEPKNIIKTRYSLSTKIADCLSCGTCLFAYGPKNIASIDYLIKNKCACVITNKNNLAEMLKKIISDSDLQDGYIKKALEVADANHNSERNSDMFRNIICAVTGRV